MDSWELGTYGQTILLKCQINQYPMSVGHVELLFEWVREPFSIRCQSIKIYNVTCLHIKKVNHL